MTIYYQGDHVTLHHGDCLDVLATLPDESVHAVVTDPPYGFGMAKSADILEVVGAWLTGAEREAPEASMRRKGRGSGMSRASDTHDWDAFVPPPAIWREVLRVLKPGGHMVAACAPRTVDVLTIALRVAGFEVRDSIAWLYGSGMPKTYELSKTVTALQRGYSPEAAGISRMSRDDGGKIALTPDGERWHGWASALKPAHEPWILAYKPLRGTIPANVLDHGTGALNIDACRHGAPSPSIARREARRRAETVGSKTERDINSWAFSPLREGNYKPSEELGRWPSNAVIDAEMLDELPESARHLLPSFKWAPKASRAERHEVDGVRHPTVKPLELMRWLVRLITPPGGIVLEPFAGSGTTGEAATLEGFRSILIEREESYLPLITARIARAHEGLAAPEQPALDL